MAQSGTPFTVENYAQFSPATIVNGQYTNVQAGDYNADGYAQDYPNVARNVQRKYSHGQVTQAGGGVFANQMNAFTAPLPGTEGNEGRNTFRNPGLFEWDASVLKNNKLPWFGAESANLQLRVDGFNVINHTNFNAIDNNLASGTFGQATSSLQPRIIQLGARFEF